MTGVRTGIGRAIEAQLVHDGAAIAIFDIDDDKGKKVRDEPIEGGTSATYVHADITNPEAVNPGIQRVQDEFGTIDVLVNNAAFTIAENLEAISLDV